MIEEGGDVTWENVNAQRWLNLATASGHKAITENRGRLVVIKQ